MRYSHDGAVLFEDCEINVIWCISACSIENDCDLAALWKVISFVVGWILGENELELFCISNLPLCFREILICQSIWVNRPNDSVQLYSLLG